MPLSAALAVSAFVTGALLRNPRRVGHALGGDFHGYLAARKGPYRVVYRVDDDAMVVQVVRTDHRADVYRPT